ncbi:MAG TPA: hypothetical protein VGZ47_07365, partial [Gemmataceae bacterium]|nr:hypothetical protein [Gemmataceae bacterium]
SFDCVIWSTTRDWVDFDLKLSPLEGKQANECFVLGPVQQVSAGELATLAKTVGSIHASTLPRCAYHFTFTVYENRNSQQLDLGPFYRVLVISSGPEIEPIRVAITGLVRGEVQLVGGEKDQIPLGSFRSDRGTTKVVTLVAPKNVTLEYARVTTDAIKSKLELAEERDGRRFWKLIVEAPPESFTGDLQSAAIVLKVKKGDSKEAPERSLRIPVTGNAYR